VLVEGVTEDLLELLVVSNDSVLLCPVEVVVVETDLFAKLENVCVAVLLCSVQIAAVVTSFDVEVYASAALPGSAGALLVVYVEVLAAVAVEIVRVVDREVDVLTKDVVLVVTGPGGSFTQSTLHTAAGAQVKA